jgi:hypothetical protein
VPIYDGGNAIVEYKVYMSPVSSTDYQLLATTTDLNVEATGLNKGSLYYFHVTASNIIGESTPSVASSFLAAQAPSAPIQPQIVTQSATAITIQWYEPENNGSNIDDYQVKMCSQEIEECSFALAASTTSGLLTYTTSGLVKGTFYQLKVQAHNSIGFGAESEALTAVAANKPNQPLAPENVEELTDRTQIAIKWQEPLQNVGSDITSYLVWWKT